ncbi:hypothetical protein BDZ91DRAFT_237345 [Kalaharituber pfeilii]|nr:hypothetical protein BDZ91DRAFT_237345 [Kalaharituber pfeilii]
MSTLSTALVIQSNGKRFTVDLDRQYCECGHFTQNGIPCGHALSVIQHLQQPIHFYIPPVFWISTWKNTFLRNLKPILIDNLPTLENGPTIIPPTNKQKLRGRPKINRFQHGSQRKASKSQAGINSPNSSNQQKCSHCHTYGHKRSTCLTKMPWEDAPKPVDRSIATEVIDNSESDVSRSVGSDERICIEEDTHVDVSSCREDIVKGNRSNAFWKVVGVMR